MSFSFSLCNCHQCRHFVIVAFLPPCLLAFSRTLAMTCLLFSNNKPDILSEETSNSNKQCEYGLKHFDTSKLLHIKTSLFYRNVVSAVPDSNADILSNDVACQGVYQVPSDVITVSVQRSNQMMLGVSDSRTPASVPDNVILLIDSHHGSSARYLYQPRHELSSPWKARLNVTFVVVTHKPVEFGVANLYAPS